MKPTRDSLVKNYIGLVYYFARRWVYKPEDADDMVQETYKKALMKYDTFNFKSESQLKSWLLTICRNTVMDSQKLKKQMSSLDIETIIDDENDLEHWLDNEIKREDLVKLTAALRKLENEDHDVINLRYLNEFSFKEVAEALQISEAQGKMRCYRALAKLKKLIQL